MDYTYVDNKKLSHYIESFEQKLRFGRPKDSLDLVLARNRRNVEPIDNNYIFYNTAPKNTTNDNKDTYYQKVTDTVSPFEQMSKIDQVAFEKTVRDLAARMSDRIGIPYKIINNVNEKYKGKLSNGTAYINLAYCDMSTISHEVLGHSIIRALKNKSELSFKEQLNKEVYQGNIEKKC